VAAPCPARSPARRTWLVLSRRLRRLRRRSNAAVCIERGVGRVLPGLVCGTRPRRRPTRSSSGTRATADRRSLVRTRSLLGADTCPPGSGARCRLRPRRSRRGTRSPRLARDRHRSVRACVRRGPDARPGNAGRDPRVGDVDGGFVRRGRHEPLARARSRPPRRPRPHPPTSASWRTLAHQRAELRVLAARAVRFGVVRARPPPSSDALHAPISRTQCVSYPSRKRRRARSASSPNMKYASSNPPASSSARRR
jgi:hypothetical protein